MTPCAVAACIRNATDEIKGTGTGLCAKHAAEWDGDDEHRITRLYELQQGDLNADMDAVWAEYFSEWCGGRA